LRAVWGFLLSRRQPLVAHPTAISPLPWASRLLMAWVPSEGALTARMSTLSCRHCRAALLFSMRWLQPFCCTARTRGVMIMDEGVLRRMRQEATAAAELAGVSVRPITSHEGFAEVRALFDATWGGEPTNPTVTVELLRALSKAGAYVVGAYDGHRLAGATVGFFGPPNERALHSHVTGVTSAMRGRNVGLALKLFQRVWALEMGLTSITWTFDPLVRRNAHFNIRKLGGRLIEYLPNFYGAMLDQINRDGDSDRALVKWDLNAVSDMADRERLCDAQDALVVAPDGRPRFQATEAAVLLIATPPDIEAVRATDATLGTEWRVALREALGERMLAGNTVIGFDRLGRYIVDTRKREGKRQ